MFRPGLCQGSIVEETEVNVSVLKEIQDRARRRFKTIVFPEAQDERILRAAEHCFKERLVQPTLVGAAEKIRAAIEIMNRG